MSKAFDSFHPPLLLSKLKAYGCSESLLTLIWSYLSDRKYREKIGAEEISEWKSWLEDFRKDRSLDSCSGIFFKMISLTSPPRACHLVAVVELVCLSDSKSHAGGDLVPRGFNRAGLDEG